MSVPQVASPSANAHAHRPAQANAARPAAERGTPSLFESLVDDNSSTAAQQSGPAPGAAAVPGQTPSAKSAPAADGKADAAKADTSQAQTATDPAAAAMAAAQADDATAAVAGAAATLAGGAKTDTTKTDGAKADAKGDTAKTDAGADATIGAGAAGAVDPAVAAEAAAAVVVAPPSTDQQAPAAPGAAVTATVQGAAATTPMQPAFIAATAAQKLQALDGKPADGKSADGKAADKTKPDPAAASAGAKTAAAVASDGKPGAPQGVQPAADPDANADGKADSTPDAKTAAAGKDATAKTSAHQTRSDGASTIAARFDAAAAGGTDPTAGTQAAAASAGATGATAGTATTGSTVPAATTTAALLAPAVPLSGLAIEIAGKAQAGNNQFAIRLDPPELGRIEVKLAIDRQGQITSHLIADRADTLDLLRRDAGGLERALQDAGLKTSGDGLQFSLRDQSFAGQQNRGGPANAAPVVTPDDSLPTLDIAASGYTRYTGRIGGVDIRV